MVTTLTFENLRLKKEQHCIEVSDHYTQYWFYISLSFLILWCQKIL